MAGDIIILHMCAENHDHKKYSSRDTERDRQDFLSFWAIFCSSTPLTTQKMKILKKRNKYLEVWSFYTCAPKTMIIWCMFLEIWSASDKKFCRFGPFFALLPHYWPWKLKFGKNMVKTPEDTILLQMCTIKWKSYNIWFLRYEVWQTKILLFWVIFLPFYPTNNSKNQNLEKMKKKILEILPFYTGPPKIMIICYTVPEILHKTDGHSH